MKQVTREWVEKAEADFITARRELRARKLPNYDASCFHAQQCAEKYLKAYLQEIDIPFSKTHDLSVALDLILPIEPLWESFRPQLRALTVYAVEFRYPGESADQELAREAVSFAKFIRLKIRRALKV